jgi:uncharacterized protein YyaL (SSP411 family)
MSRILITLIITILIISSCKSETKDANMEEHKYTNDLIHETSPYLLQHAHNPVDWKPWKQETLDLAKKENKLIIISVGYAACHWCHVMEHESFENDSVAKIMNDNFISIKVDREERPDVDQVYMNAVQLMTGTGGWPLNCITLPDGRPIFGGTYFEKEKWISLLNQLSTLYKEQPEKAIEYAEKLTEGIQNSELITLNSTEAVFTAVEIKKNVDAWTEIMDFELGGTTASQKFPTPTNYHFLLRYGFQSKNERINEYTNTTLTKMAYGGLYDQIGGGFSRYSVDKKWHVPHFEKMLYDNGQLVSLYSDAYLITKNELYQKTVEETLTFVERELMSEEGGFYSSLDADSLNAAGELEEGAYYVWTKAELEKVIGSDFEIFQEYYNINKYGFWEHDNYVLIRNKSDKEIASRYDLTVEKLQTKVVSWKANLLKERDIRERPRLDDKILTSLNALMLKGYADAYRVFENPHYLEIALRNAHFLVAKLQREDGGLNHNYKNGKSNINGYLEDYSALIDAFISLYEVTLDEQWLMTSRRLSEYTFDHFYDTESGMFFFTSDEDDELIARKMDVYDKEIPSSNSIMARSLAKLSHYFSNNYYLKTSKQMLNNVKESMTSYPAGYSNWLQLMSDFSIDYYEIAVSGEDAMSKLKKINQTYIPNKLIAGSTKDSSIPLMEGRFNDDITFIYICVDGACKLPEEEVSKAIKQLKVHY